jgi:Putative peptidoglycan binding domain
MEYMSEPILLGVVADTRTATQKEYDFKHEEVFTSSVPTYHASKQEASQFVGTFPTDNQNGTSSCVAHGKVLVMSIFNYLQGITPNRFVALSSMFIYRNRANYPGEGMVPSSANMQTIKGGAPIYADLPTPETEAAANAIVIDAAMTQAAKQFVGGKWVQIIDPTEIDTIAFVANSLILPLNILFYSTYEEWAKEDVTILTPNLQQGDPLAVVSHCVTVLPNSAYMENGKRKVIIQDSAFFGGFQYRSVDEDFIRARLYESDYMIGVGNQPVIVKPKVNLQSDLTIGSSGPDVLALQQALQYLGYFPNVLNGGVFSPTGQYFGMTKNAVLKFQNEYASEILTPNGLSQGTGYCGSSTRAFINKLFA